MQDNIPHDASTSQITPHPGEQSMTHMFKSADHQYPTTPGPTIRDTLYRRHLKSPDGQQSLHDVLRALDAARSCLEKAANSREAFYEKYDLPEVFHETANQLSILPIALLSIAEGLQEAPAAGLDKTWFSDLMPFSEKCQQRTECFNDVFDRVTVEGNLSKVKRYYLVAEKWCGVSLEAVMQDLLTQTLKIMTGGNIFVDKNLIIILQTGLEKFSELKPSLQSMEKPVVVNNFGSGNQHFHRGSQQNHYSLPVPDRGRLYKDYQSTDRMPWVE
ncbi:hypothetical protein V8C34DRAFT_284371 [Trichoderma compactum]